MISNSQFGQDNLVERFYKNKKIILSKSVHMIM